MKKAATIITLPVLVGLGLLIIGAYFDNVRGPLLPHIAKNMGFNYSGSSFFLVIGHIAAGFATAALMPALNRYTERSIAWMCLSFALLTCLAAAQVTSYGALLIFAGAIGVCTSVLGAMSNVVVITTSTPAKAGRNLALLHVMYGVGSTLATVVTGQVLAHGLSWTVSLLVLTPVILALAWQTRSLPTATMPGGSVRQQPMGLQAQHWLVIALFAAYVAGEVLTSMWMTTYLVEADGLEIGQAAWYATAFFVVLAASRCLMIFTSVHRWSTWLLGGSLMAGLVFAVLGLTVARWCLPLIGLLGPFFPLLLARASRLYPHRNRTITVHVIIAMQITLGTLHFTIGQISQQTPVSMSYWMAPAALLIAAILLVWHLLWTKEL